MMSEFPRYPSSPFLSNPRFTTNYTEKLGMKEPKPTKILVRVESGSGCRRRIIQSRQSCLRTQANFEFTTSPKCFPRASEYFSASLTTSANINPLTLFVLIVRTWSSNWQHGTIYKTTVRTRLLLHVSAAASLCNPPVGTNTCSASNNSICNSLKWW